MACVRMKILCLHGKQQNKEIFRTKLGRIPHKLKHLAELTIIDAPHVLADDSETSTPISEIIEKESLDGATATAIVAETSAAGRTWFRRDASGSIEMETVAASINMLKNVWTENGPFDGVLGFSMGGTVAGLLAAAVDTHREGALPNFSSGHDTGSSAESGAPIKPLVPGLKFIICAGAVDIQTQFDTTPFAMLPLHIPITIPTAIASLHIAGKADTAVPISSSIALAQRFTDAKFIEHEQGHHIPMKAYVLNGIVDFVAAQQHI